MTLMDPRNDPVVWGAKVTLNSQLENAARFVGHPSTEYPDGIVIELIVKDRC